MVAVLVHHMVNTVYTAKFSCSISLFMKENEIFVTVQKPKEGLKWGRLRGDFCTVFFFVFFTEKKCTIYIYMISDQ